MLKKIIAVSILVFALILVRYFQYDLFYDPFLFYFKSAYLNEAPLPEYSMSYMVINLLYRYAINTTISLIIIYVIFRERSVLKFALFIYILAILVILPLYIYNIYTGFSHGYLQAFYLRRFIIQPVLLLILLPALWYQKITTDKN